MLALLCCPAAALAGPEEDRAAFVAYYQSRFQDVLFEEFANGIYAIDADSRAQWEMIEEFPPYEFSIERGESLWAEALPNETGWSWLPTIMTMGMPASEIGFRHSANVRCCVGVGSAVR